MEERIYAERYLEEWSLSKNWKNHLHPFIARLWRDFDDIEAWKQLAMILGDSNAGPLCLIICRFAVWKYPSSQTRSAVGPHYALSLWDLGLGEMGEGGIRPNEEAIEAWFTRELAPWDGDLQSAATFCLCLTALRLSVISGSKTPDLNSLIDLENWELTPQGA